MSVILRERKLPSGNTQLYLDIHRYVAKGEYERHTESLFVLKKGETFDNREKRRMAEELRSRRSLELEAQAHGIVSTQKRTSNFIRYLEEQRDLRAGKTRVVWLHAVNHFREFAGEQVTFAELTPTLMDRFRAHLLKKVKPNSARIYLGCIKSVLLQAVKDGILVNNPALETNIRKTDTLPVYLTLEDLKKLDSTPCKYTQMKAAFLFSCFTGLRYSDVRALTWGNVRDSEIRFQTKKTRREQIVPLSAEALSIIEAQKGAKPDPGVEIEIPEDRVFKMPSEPAVNKWLKVWGNEAKLGKSMSFHKARHTHAMMLRRAGVGLETIRGILGHSSLSMAEKYARLTQTEMEEAVKKIPRLNGGSHEKG